MLTHTDTPAYKRYQRVEAAWLSLAEEQDWLDGEIPPVQIAVTDTQKSGHKNGG